MKVSRIKPLGLKKQKVSAERMCELTEKYLIFTKVGITTVTYCGKCGQVFTRFWSGINHLFLCLDELKQPVEPTCKCGSAFFVELKKCSQCMNCGTVKPS